MADKEALVTQFTDVTGVESERARFFLESSAWQLEVALASFYENDGDDNLDVVEADDDIPEIVNEIRPVSSQEPVEESTASKPKPVVPSRNTRFGTIAGLHQPTNSGSSDEEEGQAFYAGGSRTSGQQVLGPPTKKKDIVSEMFKSVQEHGAEVVDPRHPGPDRAATSSSFSGAGYRLGQSNNDSEVIGVPSAARPTEVQSEVVLKLWKTGFSINEEPIRPYADPANREFLESVRRGEVPMELLREARGEEVHLNMEDHRNEEYAAPRVKARAFMGKGNLLGSPSPVAVGLTKPVTIADRESNESQAREKVPLDEERPVTTVQIRLADGSRLIGRFNTSNTVADIRTYITAARPQYEHQNFVLLTTFPSKELIEDQTLDQAGVLNASVLQRLK